MIYPTESERREFRAMAESILTMGELDWPPPTVLVFKDWLDELAIWNAGPPPAPPFE
ncbi:hypothetical protein ACFSC3_04065 [Sphingomonas floccifaciens]|uniref:Uncharacterized protein n=1 Tax=Sphingomonas floccifaciens TaxID=1844115 RepID=A0ABW4N9T1_9SPHN